MVNLRFVSTFNHPRHNKNNCTKSIVCATMFFYRSSRLTFKVKSSYSLIPYNGVRVKYTHVSIFAHSSISSVNNHFSTQLYKSVTVIVDIFVTRTLRSIGNSKVASVHLLKIHS